MKPQYITIGDKKVRIEVNWNALIDFLDLTGLEFNAFVKDASKGDINPRHVRTLIWCSASEGERMDDKELDLTEEDVGGLLTPATVNDFVAVFTKQWTSGTKKKKEPQKRKGWIARTFNR